MSDQMIYNNDEVRERTSDWYKCVAKRVLPCRLRCMPFAEKGWEVEFAYQCDKQTAKDTAFTYLKSHFNSVNMEAFREAHQMEGHFWVKFDVLTSQEYRESLK